MSQACGEITIARMREMRWPIVLVSAHLGARTGDGGEDHTNHFWWQGKFYRLDDEAGSGEEKPLTLGVESSTVQSSESAEPDIQIGRSLGAAARKQRVRLPDGSISYLTEGTKITKIVTFAGQGTKKPFKKAKQFAAWNKTDTERWAHKREDGYVDVRGESKHAELHWFEHPDVGRTGMKVKRFFDDES